MSEQVVLPKDEQIARLAELFARFDIPARDGYPAIQFEYMGDSMPIAKWWYERGVRFVEPAPVTEEEFSPEALAAKLIEEMQRG